MIMSALFNGVTLPSHTGELRLFGKPADCSTIGIRIYVHLSDIVLYSETLHRDTTIHTNSNNRVI